MSRAIQAIATSHRPTKTTAQMNIDATSLLAWIAPHARIQHTQGEQNKANNALQVELRPPL
jgi:hypothetical protein